VFVSRVPDVVEGVENGSDQRVLVRFNVKGAREMFTFLLPAIRARLAPVQILRDEYLRVRQRTIRRQSPKEPRSKSPSWIRRENTMVFAHRAYWSCDRLHFHDPPREELAFDQAQSIK
jgi:hypothetical protein